MKNDLTIVIVSYKSGNILLECLKNIKKFQRIIVLDNSNDLNLKKIVKIKFPNVKFFLSKKNLGYPRGNNFLLKKVKTKYVILLNPDTTMKFESVIKLLETAKKLKDDFAIITPKKNNFPLKNYFINSLNYNQITKNNELLEIDKVYFYAPLFNMLKFKKYKFFDENIFLYYDDLDLCKTLKKNNEKIYLNKNSYAHHVSGKSSKSQNYNSIRFYHWGWSYFYFYKKHYSYLRAIIMFKLLFLKSIIRYISFKLFRINNINPNDEIQIIRGLLSFFVKKKDYPKSDYS